MARKPQLPEEIARQIDSINQSAADKFRTGDVMGSLRDALSAWELIPEPKAAWDYYSQSLAVGFVQDYADTRDVENTRRWIETVYEVYDDPHRTNHYPLMVEGEALYMLGLLDDAHAVFGRIYDLFGEKGFAGKQKAYLEFYRKRRSGS
jgi:hypothetical protein